MHRESGATASWTTRAAATSMAIEILQMCCLCGQPLWVNGEAPTAVDGRGLCAHRRSALKGSCRVFGAADPDEGRRGSSSAIGGEVLQQHSSHGDTQPASLQAREGTGAHPPYRAGARTSARWRRLPATTAGPRGPIDVGHDGGAGKCAERFWGRPPNHSQRDRQRIRVNSMLVVCLCRQQHVGCLNRSKGVFQLVLRS